MRRHFLIGSLAAVSSLLAMPQTAAAAVACLTSRDIPANVGTVPDGFTANGIATHSFHHAPIRIVDLSQIRAIEASALFFQVEAPYPVLNARYVQVKWIRPDSPAAFYHVFTLKSGVHDAPYDKHFEYSLGSQFDLVTSLKTTASLQSVYLTSDAAFLVTSICFANKSSEFPN